MNSRFSLSKATTAGLIGTVAMTSFTYMGLLMGIMMNIPEMLSSMFGGIILIGWMMHFIIGIVLSYGYGLLIFPYSNISPLWLRGALFGIIPWLIEQIIVMPMMLMINGMSMISRLFSGSVLMAVASLAGHSIFGSVVGSIYKPEYIVATT